MDIMRYAIEGYEDIKAEKYIGIFGNPIKHTLSPVIHDTISRELGINEKYIPFHVTDNLEKAVKTAFDEDIQGLNITVPYKQDVMKYIVDVDMAAEAIGAVNTLVRSEGGYKGYNTDMPGLAKAIISEGVSLCGSRVVMLGAGGAARAVAYMCLYYGAKKVYIVNRTYDNAAKLASDMNRQFDCDTIIPVAADRYKDIEEDRYIFIQCTSVGLHKNDGLPLITDEEFYKMADFGVDLIYNPAMTPFLKLIKKYNGKVMNGLKMLLYQGIMAYELWNDTTVSEEITDKVYIALKKALYGDNIVLIGYMGSGKTSVGRYLEENYGYTFIDTDSLIEEKEKMSISDIFKYKGEDYFRKLETDILTNMTKNLHKAVVSTGGGMPLREENVKLLREIGKVFYLEVSADTVYERIKTDTKRPLLQVDDPYSEICRMLTMRTPYYQKAKDVTLPADKKNIFEISQEIIKSREVM